MRREERRPPSCLGSNWRLVVRRRRYRRVRSEEPRRLQLRPEVSGNRLAVEGDVSLHLFRRPRAQADADYRGVGERERDRGCGQGRPMTIADGGDRPSSVEEFPWSRLVVVLRVARRLRAGEKAAVEDTRGDDADAALLAEGQEVVEAVLLEKRVAPGQHHHVDIRLTHEVASIDAWFIPAPMAFTMP